MRARTLLTSIAAGVCALAGWVAWNLESEVECVPPIARSEAHPASDLVAASPSLASAAADAPDLALPTLDSRAPSAARRAEGWPILDPDALRSVRGRVLDARTREPVAGVTLSLLSRRPCTTTVITDAQGCFHTPPELASGVVSLLHVPAADNPRFAARWELEPSQFVLSAPLHGEVEPQVHFVDVAASPPERVLEVAIRMPDGSPAPSAAVVLTSGRRDARSVFHPERRDFESSDAFGRARFALFEQAAVENTIQLEADQGGSLASEVLELDPPFTGKALVLELHPGAVVTVRAKNDEGRPLSGVSVWVSTQDDERRSRGRAGDTDGRGEAVFTALRAACYSVSVVHPLTGETLSRSVDVPRGAHVAVDVHLSLANLRLALAGSVVDELGYPLAGTRIAIEPGGEPAVELTTSADGRFEFWTRPCATLGLSAGGGFLDDEYEPSFQRLPFGTRELRIQRRRTLELVARPFVACDDATGETVKPAAFTLFHGEFSGGGANGVRIDAADGVAQIQFKLHERTRYAVDARGYLRAEGLLEELVAAHPIGRPLSVELERGFERLVVVRDRVNKKGLSGAALFSDGRAIGASDASGGVSLRAAEWPGSIAIECTGYEPATWDPWGAGFPGDTIFLEPLRASD